MAITSRLCAAHFHGLRRTLNRRLRSRQRATFCGRTDGEDPAGLGRASSSGTYGLTMSNLCRGMAESKSDQFPNKFNAHSEKIAKFDPLSTNRLAHDSE